MVIRDVIYNDITIDDEVVIKLIQTREFQRLRRIKQLGFTSLSFPCAEHTRFMHSIGVYHLGQEIADELEEKQQIKFNENEKREFMVACLLHDIGHGPFSHTAESFFNYHHEELSLAIVMSERTEINKILIENNLLEGVSLMLKKEHQNQVLNTMLSSAIDVDRMDYLRRDSYFCGVEYGKYDFGRIKKIITVKDNKVCYLAKGIHSIESFLLARYHMFSQVYLDTKTRCYEKMMQRILEIVKIKLEEGFDFQTDLSLVKKFMNGTYTIEEYLLLDDNYLTHLVFELQNEGIEEIKTLSQELEATRTIHFTKPIETNKEYYEYTIESLSKEIVTDGKEILILDDNQLYDLRKYSKLYELLYSNLKIEKEEYKFYVEK